MDLAVSTDLDPGRALYLNSGFAIGPGSRFRNLPCCGTRINAYPDPVLNFNAGSDTATRVAFDIPSKMKAGREAQSRGETGTEIERGIEVEIQYWTETEIKSMIEIRIRSNTRITVEKWDRD
ncbi:hypothetical protein EVAR_89881_1 [Eumeta japonica]|uniref:Uncharacterized protein n=1 Tax=Eumeta variegata TaxID=151549 RepID=A0A4C1ZMJ8_EUMVA|nr:hypothetical protein EVAR_89881_1 [Eumeta japonica]